MTGPETSGPVTAPPALRLRGLDKRFPGVHAVRSVDLEVEVAEIHGIVGENGAGKSTLIKMLTGVHEPDAGQIELQGRLLRTGDPAASRNAGIAAVYQETNVVPRLSAVANVFLGQELRRRGVLAEREMLSRFEELCALVGVEIPARSVGGGLSVGAQKSVEILRALQQGAQLIVMDEPTAVMPPAERETFYRTTQLLKSGGSSIIFISHNLEEVLSLCDRITVLRDGERVLTSDAGGLDRSLLVEAMLGRQLESELSELSQRTAAESSDQPVLVVRGLTLAGRLHGIDLDVQRGEILGVAGLVGSGRSSLLRALAGAEPGAVGSMSIDGDSVSWPRSPSDALRLGIALAPEERRSQGLVLSLSAAENVLLPSLRSSSRHGVIGRGRTRRLAQPAARQVNFASERLDGPAGTLSGGNQQKLILARWVKRPPGVLLVDEPVRGIDVGAKAEIFELLRELAAEGLAIVMVSEEIEEVHALADRIVVLARGRVAAELPARETGLSEIMRAMFSLEGSPA